MYQLSVLLIAYNNEKYIKETLDSLIKQKTSFKYEIVVGDDCSTDLTFKIISEYAKKHPYLFNIQQNKSQLGILNNFKTTLDRCSGEFVFNFDGDDIVKDEFALEKLAHVLKNNSNLGFVDSGFDCYISEENALIKFWNKKNIVATKKEYKKRMLLGQVIPVGICFRKDLMYKFVDFEYFIDKKITIEDYPVLVDMVMNCDFERINESLHIYRLHSASYSNTKSFDKLFFLSEQMLNLFNYFKLKYKFPEELNESYLELHYKQLLFNCGKNSQKKLGKKSFNSIKKKSFRDIIYYLASQYPLLLKIVLVYKKTYLKFMKPS
ncbi:glycosyltransferase family 2 protein [Siansivirga zeaxanthinifaciens]|uniref:Glycosyltransferase 2-like domain-containing protein n=1 Tax=Siansivirga zeaxanthinifaciens CC-SAMT-1 TaxID=1454006 RepID=A0A0C5WP71_9FLAO|nr:glycosyltransferase family 2 protein [Siansivirga zeaxanthinifaciens]AJR04705.1 hypothetical protein AW14_00785 [Siansivirga zeaxanthinifaciens CC-SAMT-1]